MTLHVLINQAPQVAKLAAMIVEDTGGRLVHARPPSREYSIPELGIFSAAAKYARSKSSVEPVAQFICRAPDSHIGAGPDLPDRNSLISRGGKIFGIEAA